MPLYDAVAALASSPVVSDYIRVEENDFAKNTRSELLGLGYDIEKKNLGCRIQAVAEDKTLVGVLDPRGEGRSDGL